jgi:hypothetical protein
LKEEYDPTESLPTENTGNSGLFLYLILYYTMKIILACLLLFSSLQGFSQKKGKVDPKDVAIDSLTKVSTMLTAQLDSTTKAATTLSMHLDSVTRELVTYKGMYTTIKEQVVKHDFNPADMGMIIDSLKAGRDATVLGLTQTTQTMTDSVAVLTKENAAQKEMISLLQAAEGDKEKLVAELKQLKELLDAKIITQAEFDEKKARLMEKW